VNSGSSNFEVDVTLTRAEIARYNFHHIRWLLLLDTAGFLALLAMTYLSIFHPSPDTRELMGSLIIWGILLLAMGLSQPFILFMQIYVLKSPAVSAQKARRKYSFDDTGIQVSSGGKKVLTPWSGIEAIKDLGRIILIFTGSRLAYVIPKRCVGTADEVRSFTRFLLSRMNRAK
jgi:hypothetical protein